jgi:predicted transcriptional regulator
MPNTATAGHVPEAILTPDEAQKFAADVARGRADVVAGRVVDGQNVQAWVDSWGTAQELPQPKPVQQP